MPITADFRSCQQKAALCIKAHAGDPEKLRKKLPALLEKLKTCGDLNSIDKSFEQALDVDKKLLMDFRGKTLLQIADYYKVSAAVQNMMNQDQQLLTNLKKRRHVSALATQQPPQPKSTQASAQIQSTQKPIDIDEEREAEAYKALAKASDQRSLKRARLEPVVKSLSVKPNSELSTAASGALATIPDPLKMKQFEHLYTERERIKNEYLELKKRMDNDPLLKALIQKAEANNETTKETLILSRYFQSIGAKVKELPVLSTNPPKEKNPKEIFSDFANRLHKVKADEELLALSKLKYVSKPHRHHLDSLYRDVLSFIGSVSKTNWHPDYKSKLNSKAAAILQLLSRNDDLQAAPATLPTTIQYNNILKLLRKNDGLLAEISTLFTATDVPLAPGLQQFINYHTKNANKDVVLENSLILRMLGYKDLTEIHHVIQKYLVSPLYNTSLTINGRDKNLRSIVTQYLKDYANPDIRIPVEIIFLLAELKDTTVLIFDKENHQILAQHIIDPKIASLSLYLSIDGSLKYHMMTLPPNVKESLEKDYIVQQKPGAQLMSGWNKLIDAARRPASAAAAAAPPKVAVAAVSANPSQHSGAGPSVKPQFFPPANPKPLAAATSSTDAKPSQRQVN